MPVRLICSTDAFNKSSLIEGLQVTKLESFYDSTKFLKIIDKIDMPIQFRNGFWTKTLERFFILEQFMKFTGIKSIFHCELDQILFNCGELVESIIRTELNGVFVPFRDSDLAIASVFYCSDPIYLESFLAFVENQESIKNEMAALASWGKVNPDSIWLLPTCASEIIGTENYSRFNLKSLAANTIGGVVDAAQIGQWIAGQDPRNLKPLSIPKIKYVEDHPELLSKKDLSKIKFKLTEKNLLVKINGNYLKIYNLHVHSKIHAWIEKSPKNLIRLINLANREKAVTIFPLLKLHFFYNLKNFLVKIFN